MAEVSYKKNPKEMTTPLSGDAYKELGDYGAESATVNGNMNATNKNTEFVVGAKAPDAKKGGERSGK